MLPLPPTLLPWDTPSLAAHPWAPSPLSPPPLTTLRVPAGPHSLRYFDVAVSEPRPGVPEYVMVGYLDGNLIARYDSDTGRAVPRADWMEKNLDGDHWDTLTQLGQRQQQIPHA
uniref:MHC class I-like antigen recognition-like domain-containing protein n=1 Tax=Otus sunia TaxID=257818 RepID=A0A8C8AI75_9STRI